LDREENSKFDLKAELKSIGMTQKEFADLIEIHKNTVSRWSRGEVPLPNWVKLFISNYKKAQLLDQVSMEVCKKNK
jgi:transcriptional regulator with XRE-family HTH domain